MQQYWLCTDVTIKADEFRDVARNALTGNASSDEGPSCRMSSQKAKVSEHVYLFHLGPQRF